jgi:cbb3-type cytochrome oxidase maturation protein
MEIMILLFCFAGIIALIALAAFLWTLKNGQYDDMQGNASRIFFDDDDKNEPK